MLSYVNHWGDTPPHHLIFTEKLWRTAVEERHWQKLAERWHASQSVDSPAECPAARRPQIPPSVSALHLGRVFLVICLLSWQQITSFLKVCHYRHSHCHCHIFFSTHVLRFCIVISELVGCIGYKALMVAILVWASSITLWKDVFVSCGCLEKHSKPLLW